MRYPEDRQIATEISEDQQHPTKLSGRLTALSAILRYPESQHSAYQDIRDINSVISRYLEYLNSPFREIRKISIALPRYLED